MKQTIKEKWKSYDVFDFKAYLERCKVEMPENYDFIQAVSKKQAFHLLVEDLYKLH